MSGFSIPPQRGIPAPNAPFVDPSMSQPNVANRLPANAPPSQASQAAQIRRRGFLSGLATLMTRRGMPLPLALTGVPSDFDPNNTPWSGIEPSSTFIGAFRLAGKDIDLFKLWWQVVQAGGGAKVCVGLQNFLFAG
jgi:SWI/SNF chromatin-remodeling complex subunit SWI1